MFAEFAAGFDIEHFVLFDCLIMFAAFTLKYSFFVVFSLQSNMGSYNHSHG